MREYRQLILYFRKYIGVPIGFQNCINAMNTFNTTTNFSFTVKTSKSFSIFQKLVVAVKIIPLLALFFLLLVDFSFVCICCFSCNCRVLWNMYCQISVCPHNQRKMLILFSNRNCYSNLKLDQPLEKHERSELLALIRSERATSHHYLVLYYPRLAPLLR